MFSTLLSYWPNYWAVFVSAVAYMVIGMLWYSPFLFGKVWMKAMHLDEKDLDGMKKGIGRSYFFSFVAALVASYVLAHFIAYMVNLNMPAVNAGQTTPMTIALQTAFWVWLGFVVTTHLIESLFEKRSFNAYLVGVGYQLACLAASAVILTVWK